MPLSAPTCSLSKGQEGKSAAIDGSGTVPSALVGPHNTAQHNKSAFSKGPLAPYSQIRHENDADVADACAAEHAYIIINVQDLSGRTHVVHAFPSTTIATIRAVLVGKSGNHEFGKAGCRLIFAGATLEPGRALSDYNIVSGYSSGMTYQIYEVLSYGDAAPPACPESCGDRERPSGLPPCNYWCVNTIYMDTSDAEVMAMNGIEV
jgi:hypothetical protein